MKTFISDAQQSKTMSKTETRERAEEYEELREELATGEIDEQEFEDAVEQLVEDGDDFLGYEQSTVEKSGRAVGSFMDKIAGLISYYLLPFLVGLALTVPVLVPGINPILAVSLSPLLIGLSVLLYALIRMA
jgi:hypothetical protein